MVIGNSLYKLHLDFVQEYCRYTNLNCSLDSLYLECSGEDTINVFGVCCNSVVFENSHSMSIADELNSLTEIVLELAKINVEVDNLNIILTQGMAYVNVPSYVENKETGKLELIFSKDAYNAMSETEKSEIRSAFLFKRSEGIWVSRAKFPNLYRSVNVAKKLGSFNKGTIGNKLSFREQQERKAERAEVRAGRYETYAENAQKRGEKLQKPINDMSGDTAFFTQPNINSSSGRAFTRQRERMFEAYDRGFEEFKKSEYYKDRAEAARATATGTKPTDKGFCIRRISESEKVIKGTRKNLEKYNGYLKRLQSGEVLHKIKGDILKEYEVNEWIDNALEIIDEEISKVIYYKECLEELGGVQFSKENIKKGYTVKLKKWGACVVTGVGPKNIKYTILSGGAAGMGGSSSYADIEEIVSSDVKLTKAPHPFKVGDKFTVSEWVSGKYVDKEYSVVKVTEERVTLKHGDEKAIVRKPTRQRSSNGFTWSLSINNGYHGIAYKPEE